MDDWAIFTDSVCGEYLRNETEKEETHSFSFISKELVINTLRSNSTPDTIYWLLRYYLQAGMHEPLINTDRDKSIYISFDPEKDMISVYIAKTDCVYLIKEESSKRFYSMDSFEKYDFIFYSCINAVVKQHWTWEALKEKAARESEVAAGIPGLIFCLSKNIASKTNHQGSDFPQGKLIALEAGTTASLPKPSSSTVMNFNP